MKIIIMSVVALAALSSPAWAAGEAHLSGAVRVRYEMIENQPRPQSNRSDQLIEIRSTVQAEYRDGPVVLTAELWDSRVYGDGARTPLTTSEVNALELVQANVAVDFAFASMKAKVQMGRFTLNIGSRRLVASDDYRNTVNGYTGIRLDMTGDNGLSATTLYVLPQQRRPDDDRSLHINDVSVDHAGFDQVLWGGTVAKEEAIGPVTAEASFYHLGERDTLNRPTRDRSLDTYGVRLFRQPRNGEVDFEVELLRQTGSISGSAFAEGDRLPVSASFLHASLGYSFPGRWKPRFQIDYDYAGGGQSGATYRRFDTLFGMRRSDFAPSGLYSIIGRTNLVSAGLKIELTPSRQVDLFTSYHPVWLADRSDSFSTSGIRDPSGKSGSFAGHQLDARVRWWMLPTRLRFEADFAALKKGRFLREAPDVTKGGPIFYGSINITAFF